MPVSVDGAFNELISSLRATRNVAIKSCYPEILATEYTNTQAAIIYCLNLRFLIDYMLQRQLAPLFDPGSPTDSLHFQNTNTALQTVEALDALKRGTDWASDAAALCRLLPLAPCFQQLLFPFRHIG